jgi:hypothetical protein
VGVGSVDLQKSKAKGEERRGGWALEANRPAKKASEGAGTTAQGGRLQGRRQKGQRGAHQGRRRIQVEVGREDGLPEKVRRVVIVRTRRRCGEEMLQQIGVDPSDVQFLGAAWTSLGSTGCRRASSQSGNSERNEDASATLCVEGSTKWAEIL